MHVVGLLLNHPAACRLLRTALGILHGADSKNQHQQADTLWALRQQHSPVDGLLLSAQESVSDVPEWELAGNSHKRMHWPQGR